MPFLFIGTTEVFFILLIAVLLFGANKLPEIARGLGEGLRYMREATEDIKSEVLSQLDKNADLKDIKDTFEQTGRDMETPIEESTRDMAKPLSDQRGESAKVVGAPPGSAKRKA
ncbi:MAG: twin-arginine translocase TatA/TatE family subunit [Flavobacteriales bacterium]